MKRRLLAFLLHHANRSIKNFCWGQYAGDFYRVKDAILRKYGKNDGYDIQHIEGKECYNCAGSGTHKRRDQYGIINSEWCWGCGGNGWFKDPQWNCLERIRFGRYHFHKPISRKYGNPSPLWEIQGMPVITGYIHHKGTWFGKYAIALIMVKTPVFGLICKRIFTEWKWYWSGRIYWLKSRLKPSRPIVFNTSFPIHQDNEDLPF